MKGLKVQLRGSGARLENRSGIWDFLSLGISFLIIVLTGLLLRLFLPGWVKRLLISQQKIQAAIKESELV